MIRTIWYAQSMATADWDVVVDGRVVSDYAERARLAEEARSGMMVGNPPFGITGGRGFLQGYVFSEDRDGIGRTRGAGFLCRFDGSASNADITEAILGSLAPLGLSIPDERLAGLRAEIDNRLNSLAARRGAVGLAIAGVAVAAAAVAVLGPFLERIVSWIRRIGK